MAFDSKQDILEWRVHPAAERVGSALAAMAVIGVFAILAALLMQSAVWGLLAAALMLMALNRFFLPSRFRIDDTGVTAKYPYARQHLSWHEVRRFRHDQRGAFLSSRARGSMLDAFGGVHLLFGPHAQLAVEQIREHMDAEAGQSCSG